MANFDDMKASIEALTGGKNTVILDNVGLPSVMVAVPKHTNKELFGGSDQTHPGHIINGVEKDVMYFSKFQNVVIGERAYSLPMRDPRTYVNFDQAVTYSRNKGEGWGLTPFSLWAEIALWCRANKTMPHGNNNYGAASENALEKGVPVSKYSDSDASNPGRTQRTATGSGPETWNHDGTSAGIADMNGNVWEWNAGLRLVDGEIQVIANANVMDQEIALNSASTAWKAIAADGSLVDPGTNGTIHLLKGANKIGTTNSADTADNWQDFGFADITLDSSLAEAPEIVKSLILYPAEPKGDYGGDHHYWNTHGERVAFCGGYWGYTSNAGVFSVGLADPRTDANDYLGFRAAFAN